MKLHELGSLCLAPVVLGGYLLATDIHFKDSKYKNSQDNAAMIEVMTCEKGLGLDFKAATNGLYGANLQYGFKFEPVQDFSISILPKLGVSHVDHQATELPQRTQFGLGGQLLLGYQQYRVGVELWHLSNGADLHLNTSDKPNIGMNNIILQFGWAF